MTEETMIESIVLKAYIRQFSPGVRDIFYNAWGKALEAIPAQLLSPDAGMERFLEELLALNSERSQRILLMRLGIATGCPMSLTEIAAVLGITPERVRQTEHMFFSRFRPRVHHQKFRSTYT